MTTTLLRFVDYSNQFFYEERKVTIEFMPLTKGGKGELMAINLNDGVRDYILELPFEDHKKFYSAYCIFKEYLEEGSISFRLEDGDLVCFDNRRVLHGRQKFISVGQSARFLQGTYLSWEDVLSVKNTLTAKQQL